MTDERFEELQSLGYMKGMDLVRNQKRLFEIQYDEPELDIVLEAFYIALYDGPADDLSNQT